MALFDRTSLKNLLREAHDSPCQVYLFFGERYLCRQASQELEAVLLRSGGTVHPLDGEETDMATLCARLRSFSLLPGRQIYRVSDTRLFHSKNIAQSLWNKLVKAWEHEKKDLAVRHLDALLTAGGLDPLRAEETLASLSSKQWKQCFGFAHPGGDLGWTAEAQARLRDRKRVAAPTNATPADNLLLQLLEEGFPDRNILILLAEEVDRRKKLFTTLKKQQAVVDLSVDSGSGSRAKKVQESVIRDLVAGVLKEMGKTMAPPVFKALMERVGFHPVAAVMETEKLCLSIGENRQITRQDLDAIVGRTRQEALFELTGALGERQLDRALAICGHLLESNIHPLAIVSVLRSYCRTLLLFRALQKQPEYGYHPSLAMPAFQNTCLPRLKEKEQWSKELSGHPYAVYMQFKTAAAFSLARLVSWQHQILRAEYRLKRSALNARLVLEHLLCVMLVPPGKGEREDDGPRKHPEGSNGFAKGSLQNRMG